MSNRRKLRQRIINSKTRRNFVNGTPGRLGGLAKWLERKRTQAFIALASLVLAVVGLVFVVVPLLTSASPPNSLSIVRNTAGPSPTRYLHGKPSAKIKDTNVIVFNQRTASKYGSVYHLAVKYTARCDSQRSASFQPGTYACLIISKGRPWVENPCFGIGPKQVICSDPIGTLTAYSVVSPTYIKKYNGSFSVGGHHLPWRLTLDNGLECSWNFLDFRGRPAGYGHSHGGWFCSNSKAGWLLEPESNGHQYFGTKLSEIDAAFVSNMRQVYYAENLVQGDQRTWSVWLESPGDLEHFTPESVAQAWY
jgi:hypothetical protein